MDLLFLCRVQRFQRGETQVLVATTVIEVGVDVPQATIMVIEDAERFGLAQLHQLRGRVGRGAGRSTCLLLYKGPLGEAVLKIAVFPFSIFHFPSTPIHPPTSSSLATQASNASFPVFC